MAHQILSKKHKRVFLGDSFPNAAGNVVSFFFYQLKCTDDLLESMNETLHRKTRHLTEVLSTSNQKEGNSSRLPLHLLYSESESIDRYSLGLTDRRWRGNEKGLSVLSLLVLPVLLPFIPSIKVAVNQEMETSKYTEGLYQ